MESGRQVAVITGAASGIGLALTRVCISNGMQVVMADHAAANLYKEAEQLRKDSTVEILSVVCDVSKAEELSLLAKQTLEHFKRVDWLFNNAGISGQLAPIWELKTEDIRKTMDVNLFGVIHGLQAFLPLMFHQKHRSHVINMASFYGLCSGSLMASYAMSKHAIVALSESLYFDLKRLDKPVNVSVVCPSFANTALIKNSSAIKNNDLNHMLAELMARSKPAIDVAEHIIREVKNNTFYILPDKEVKDYCEQRTKAIIEQAEPFKHSLEKIIASLAKRVSTRV